jgi:hypothetical protein
MTPRSLSPLIALFIIAPSVRAQSPKPANPPVVATLTLPHATVLPGVPFDMQVRLTNVSDRTVTVGLYGRLVIRDAGGRTLTLKEGDEWPPHNRCFFDAQGDVELAPSETAMKMASLGGGDCSFFPEYSGPGIYDIELDLYAHNDGQNLPDYAGVIRTSTARLTRIAVGEDATVWERMMEIAEGQWTDGSLQGTREGLALSEEILAHHPDSNYYPYAFYVIRVQRGTAGEADINPLLATAKRFPSSPVYPYLLGAAAGTAFVEAGRAEYHKNKERQARFEALAKTLAAEAMKVDHLTVRESLVRSLQNLPENRGKPLALQ